MNPRRGPFGTLPSYVLRYGTGPSEGGADKITPYPLFEPSSCGSSERGENPGCRGAVPSRCGAGPSEGGAGRINPVL